MKLVSWNVNGIRACISKNCLVALPLTGARRRSFAFGAEGKTIPSCAEVICLQETKCPDKILGLFPDYPHQSWNSALKAGYAGTAVFSKEKPVSVSYGIGIKEHDLEGRVICLEFPLFYLVNVYVPNSGRGLPRLKYRQKWDADFLAFLKKLEKSKPVVLCGDLNVAHTPLDLANPKSNYNKTAGYTQAEIDGIEAMLKAGFIDTFRELHKEGGNYSFWGQWNDLRARNIGWRIDYFLISASLRPQLKEAFILPKIMGSDHCPVGMEIKI